MVKSIGAVQKLAGVCLVSLVVTACGSNKFASNQNPGSRPQPVNPAGPVGGSPGGGVPTSNPGVNPQGSGNAMPGLLVNQGQADCLLKKADHFNINLVFDNSGSTNTTDPTNVRQQGAIQFVRKFIDFVAANPRAEVKMSTISFYRQAVRGAHGWVRLAVNTEQSIVSDVQTSTTGSQGGTTYTAAAQESTRLMGEGGANPADKRQRNYVIFLSDGRPNGSGETRDNVAALFDPLVNQHGVAIYSIAAGSGLESKDEQVMRSIAKPTVGTVSPQHLGVYKKAGTPAELQGAWDQIFNQIASCE